jgi:hypothetical protein
MSAKNNSGEVVSIHKHSGKTPETRERQRANLKPQAPLKHGAYSAERLQPAYEAILGEFIASFPAVRRDRLELAAWQRARITLLNAYVSERGLIAHRRRGTSPPAVALLRQEEASYRAELTKIEELAHEAGVGRPNTQAIIDAHTAGDDGND